MGRDDTRRRDDLGTEELPCGDCMDILLNALANSVRVMVNHLHEWVDLERLDLLPGRASPGAPLQQGSSNWIGLLRSLHVWVPEAAYAPFAGQTEVSNIDPLVTLLNLRQHLIFVLVDAVLTGQRFAPEWRIVDTPYTFSSEKEIDAPPAYRANALHLLSESDKLVTEIRNQQFGAVDVQGKTLQGAQLREEVTKTFIECQQLDNAVTQSKASRHASATQQKAQMRDKGDQLRKRLEKLHDELERKEGEKQDLLASKQELNTRLRDINEKYTKLQGENLPKLARLEENLSSLSETVDVLTADAELLGGMFAQQAAQSSRIEGEMARVLKQRKRLENKLSYEKKRLDYMKTELQKKETLVDRTAAAQVELFRKYEAAKAVRRAQGVVRDDDERQLMELKQEVAERDAQLAAYYQQRTEVNEKVHYLEMQKKWMIRVYTKEVGKPPPVLLELAVNAAEQQMAEANQG